MPRILWTPIRRIAPLLVISATGLATALATACGGGGDPAAPVVEVKPAAVASVTVTLNASALVVGQSTSASAETRDASGTVLSGRTVTWSSGNPAVATVASDGSVQAVAPGTTDIRATSESRTGSASLTVTAVPVASITLSADSLDAPIRGTATLAATVRNAAGQSMTDRLITWQSSASNIATVSSTGVVNMLYPGTVTITATCEGRTATARVRGTIGSLTRIVDSIRAASGVPAIGSIVVTREGVAAIGVSGTRRATGGAAVTVSDQWHIGSDLKAITAMLAGISVDAGVLTWNTTLETGLPDIASVMRAEYKPVTLHELLGHVSGLQNTLDGLGVSPVNLNAVRTAWIRYAVQQVPNNPRGQYYYSNVGYGAAGTMIERAWGSTFEDVFFSKLLQPLGITSAGWGPTTIAGGNDQPVGHMRVNNAWVACEACDNPPASSPMGRMHMSLEAWARITQELMLADQGRSTLLKQATARLLTTSQTATGDTPYGMGWIIVNPNAGSRLIVHDGSNNANHSRATVALDTGIAFLININAADLPGGTTGNVLTAVNNRLNVWWATGK